MESLKDQILKSDVIPIIIAKELEVECCVRGHHVYESKNVGELSSPTFLMKLIGMLKPEAS